MQYANSKIQWNGYYDKQTNPPYFMSGNSIPGTRNYLFHKIILSNSHKSQKHSLYSYYGIDQQVYLGVTCSLVSRNSYIT